MPAVGAHRAGWLAGVGSGLASAAIFAWLWPVLWRRFGLTPMQSLILGLSGGTITPAAPAGLALLALLNGLWMAVFAGALLRSPGHRIPGAVLSALALEGLAASSLLGRLPFSLAGALWEAGGYALAGLVAGGLLELQGRTARRR